MMLQVLFSFKIAVTALVTGSFSAMNAIGQFYSQHFLVFLVGAIIGALVVSLRVYLTSNKGLKDSNTLTFIQLLTPLSFILLQKKSMLLGLLQLW